MGERKKTFLTTLGESDARWVEAQAPVFGSVSAVLRLCVMVVRGLILAGSLRWAIPSLQALVGNTSNTVGEGFPAEERQSESGLADTAGTDRVRRPRVLRYAATCAGWLDEFPSQGSTDQRPQSPLGYQRLLCRFRCQRSTATERFYTVQAWQSSFLPQAAAGRVLSNSNLLGLAI